VASETSTGGIKKSLSIFIRSVSLGYFSLSRTEAVSHSETVAMAKRPVLLTVEHIVVFKSCK